MGYKKCLMLFSFILIFAISGCGKKLPEEQTGEPLSRQAQGLYTEEIREEAEPSKLFKEKEVEKNTVGLIVRETPKTPDRKKAIVQLKPGDKIEITLGELVIGDTMIADFEGWPNNLGGEIGVYGSLEPNWDDKATVPYSWVYEPDVPGYDLANVYRRKQSFRLVSGLGLKSDETWGSFAMDLGPATDLTVIPKEVTSFDASGYRYLTFWVRGEKGGEKMEFLTRDAHALSYMPQVIYKLPDATTEWQKITVPLEEFKGRIDLTALDNIGLAFGKDVGNLKGEIIYVDDFMFSNSE